MIPNCQLPISQKFVSPVFKVMHKKSEVLFLEARRNEQQEQLEEVKKKKQDRCPAGGDYLSVAEKARY